MSNKSATRWMVVDGDPGALEAVARLLGAITDAEICAFPSPWQALDAFTAAPETFQLIVADFEMPGMNGVDFRRHVQALAPSARVLLTTAGRLVSEESARRDGFCGLLCKPFSIGTLRTALQNLAAVS